MSNINYKEKALKYKLKYLNLKKQLSNQKRFKGGSLVGGMSDEDYDKFSTELCTIYNAVSGNYTTDDGEPVLTGSGAIAFVLKQLGMEEDLASLSSNDINPHDLDFLYISSRLALRNPSSIINYNIDSAHKTASSAKFLLPETYAGYSARYIKSFDVTKAGKVKSFNFKCGYGNIKIINLKRLKEDYEDNTDDRRFEKDNLKIQLIDKIIQTIKDKGLEEQYGLITESSKPQGKGSSMFGPDTDDDDDNDFVIKKPSSDIKPPNNLMSPDTNATRFIPFIHRTNRSLFNSDSEPESDDEGV